MYEISVSSAVYGHPMHNLYIYMHTCAEGQGKLHAMRHQQGCVKVMWEVR